MNYLKKYRSLILLTIISGFLSGLLIDSWNYFPGIVFGIALGRWFFVTQKTYLMKVLLWVGTSTLAYYIAFYTFFFVGELFDSNIISGFFSAGLVGGMLLAISTKLLIVKLNQKQIVIVALLGGMAGLIFAVEIASSFLPHFILWQMVVGTTLGSMVDRNKQNNEKII